MALENPFYKQIPVGKYLVMGSFILIIALAGIAIVVYSQYQGSTQASRNAFTTAETQNLISRIEDRLTRLLEPNSAETLSRLQSDMDAIDGKLTQLAMPPADAIAKLMPYSADVKSGLTNIQDHWRAAESDLNKLLTKKETLEKLGQARNATLVDQTAGDKLFQLAREIGELAIRQDEAPTMTQAATQLDGLVFRLSRNARLALSTGPEKAQAVKQLQQDALAFRSLTNRLLNGDNTSPGGMKDPQACNKLTEFLNAAKSFQQGVETLVSEVGSVDEMAGEIDTIKRQLTRVSNEAVSLAASFAQPTIGKRGIAIAAALAALMLAVLFYMLYIVRKDTRGREKAAAFESQRNQEAILKLLEETTPMGEGDLTVRASVDEAITGAIADALNFMLEEMSAVIRRINSTADQVTQETETVQDVSERLYVASQKQNREIETTANTVLQVTQSISDVAEAAGQSAGVAQQSLEAAGKGAIAVRSQIDSMSEIRSQIQETAKRIKRLGDSSLEIGEIVNLISDITDQTNVLALNAAIQAASAGDAGRGFAVVAEEVQRLAERSAEATKQISAIVKTIQSDTQDAISAMERSTSGVVEGTRLSEEAGDALADIERVSNRLAELIRNISQLTHAQAMSVDEVREAIASILNATEVATQGAEQTTTSVNRLTQVAAELRAAVSGFKV